MNDDAATGLGCLIMFVIVVAALMIWPPLLGGLIFFAVVLHIVGWFIGGSWKN